MTTSDEKFGGVPLASNGMPAWLMDVIQPPEDAPEPEKFTAVVSNPPYQMETAVKETDGQKTVTNVFQHFQEAADYVSCKVSMIYPGERWVHQSGKGMKEFGLNQINSPYLKRVIFFPANNTPFGKMIEIRDGVTIVFKDFENNNNGLWELVTFNLDERKNSLIALPGESIIALNSVENSILEKTKASTRSCSLAQRGFSQKLFGLESNFVEENPELVVRCNGNFTNSPGDGWLKALLNDKSGSAGRSQWYWLRESSVPTSIELGKQWKVVTSSVHTTGTDGRSTNVEIFDNNSIFGRSRLGVGFFDTREEAVNFFNWMKTDFVRALLATSGDLLSSFARNVPDPVDFRTDGDSGLDFTESEKSLNDQLCDKYGLTIEEREYVSKLATSLAPFSKFEYKS